jgi:hypothetical protein
MTRGRRGTARSLVLGCLAACIALLISSSAAVAGSLPDGRAWEMVSPLEKNGGEINGINGELPNEGLPEGGIVQAAANGNSITYLSLLAFTDSEGSEPLGAPIASQYLSRRKSDQWWTENLTTAVNSGTYAPAGSGAPYRAFSSDLSLALMLSGIPPSENPPLLNGVPERYENYYLRDDENHAFINALLTKAPSEEPHRFSLELVGVTPDLKHSVALSEASLTPEATHQERGNLYEWGGGWSQPLQPINVLPEMGTGSGVTASGGALLGMGKDEDHTISNDGSRVFWSRPSREILFVRENIGTPQAVTVQIDASQVTAPKSPLEEGGHGEFKTASVDGSRVFFTDRNRLTTDSTAGGFRGREDLYMLDIDSDHLTDLSVDGSDPEGASVQGVLDASNDGSYVYFVAEGSLPGTEGGISGRNNLYVWHEGSEKFIGILSNNDSGHSGFREPGVAHDWDFSTVDRTVRITADGRHLLFMSDENLTDYDNRDANRPGVRDEEIYLYDATSDHLTCISCNPGGVRPTGPSGFPGGTAWLTSGELGTYQSHVLSEDGSRVFFDSKDALVAQDTNGVQDVYEWENGHVYLLSGATSLSDSSFVDASTSGSDVFFITRAQLVGQDTDQLRDLYDARVGGGFGPPTTALACEGESCLPPSSSPPTLGSLGSTTFSGAGNFTLPTGSTTRSKVKKQKRVKPKHRKRHAKKAGRKASAGKRQRSQRRR